MMVVSGREFDEGNKPIVGVLVAFQGKRGFMDKLDVYYTTYYGDPITGNSPMIAKSVDRYNLNTKGD